MSARRLLVGLVLSLASLFFLVTPTFAQTSPSPINSSNYKAPQNADYSLINIQHAIFCQLAGISPAGQCIGLTKSTDPKNPNKIVAMLYDKLPSGGGIGALAMATAGIMSTPPTSTVQYLADIGSNLGIVSPAYAQASVQGSGDGVIKPVRVLWEIVRNIAYLFFIVVFIIVGLMIMFRQRINQQTVVTIQAALPGMVISLLIITFSYFIAAFLVDLSFLGMQFVAQVFIQAGGNAFGNADSINNLAQNSSVFQLFQTAALRPQNVTDVGGALFNTVFQQGAGTYGLAMIISGIVGGVIGSLLGPLGAVAGAGAGALVGPAVLSGLLTLIIPLILVIALFIQMFRLLFQLINSYIQILIYTITGPFYVLIAAVPGRGGVTGPLGVWWRCILANSLVFPAVFGVFLFAGFILGSTDSWTSTLPLFSGVGTNIVKLFVAYGIILATPAIPKMVRDALGCKGPDAFAQEALKGARSAVEVAQPIGQGLQHGYINYAQRILRGSSNPRLQNLASNIHRRYNNPQRNPWYTGQEVSTPTPIGGGTPPIP